MAVINNKIFMGNFQGGGNRGGGNRGGGFRGGNGGGGFRGGNGGGGFRGGDRGPVTMHKAVCDECHKECEVPFRPSGDKPIFCNECFSSKKGNDDRAPRRDFGGDRGPKRDFNDRPAPSFAKPTAPANDEVKKQLGDISAKLDRLASAIEKLSGVKATVSAPAVKPVAAKGDMPAHAGVKKVVTATKPAVKVIAKKPVVSKAPAKKVVVKKGKK